MGKRGQEELLRFVIYIFAAIIILIVLINFVSGVAGGRLVKSQILAKEIALFIDSAEPGTSMIFNYEKADVIINKDARVVTAKIENSAYTYPFFTSHDIDSEINSTSTKITIN